jgi:type I restriction enzyme M protein
MWNQDGYDTEFYDADPFDRFRFGYAPASTADWGWVQHMLASLNGKGRAVIVLDTGSVSRGSGGKGSNRERDIRKRFVDHDLIEGVILLPENLFYNTSAPGVLVCLNRAKPKERQGKIILINASKEFEKGRPKNFVPDKSILKIADAFRAGWDIPSFLTTITLDEAVRNDYNLAPSRYIAVDGREEVLTVEDAIVLLKEAEEERAVADREFDKAMDMLGLGEWRHG